MLSVKSIGAVLLVTLIFTAVFPASTASAQMAIVLDLPPGIAQQALPLLEQMMHHMHEMGMTEEHMEMMMADMQTMANILPPGIFLQILKLVSELDMMEMMQLHHLMHMGGLLQLPPGQIIVILIELAR